MLTHKLTRKHIEWERNSMNVGYAAQTLSHDVADSIQFLMDRKHPDFVGAEATIDFIRRMANLFHICNSRNSKSDDVFKRKISPENKRIFFDFFRDNIKYIKSLKIEMEYFDDDDEFEYEYEDEDDHEEEHVKAVAKYKLVPLLKSRSFCGFRGFIIDMFSLMKMYLEYVEEKHLLTSIPTYNLLQDFIEMFFGRIRACGGFNNNPNAHQWMGMY